MISIVTGLAAGSLHVFSGVDHLAALAPLAVAEPARARWTGTQWGFGHGVGVVIVGGVGLFLRDRIDVEAWSAWAEFLVGFLLIGIGSWALWRSRRVKIHGHTHEHDGDAHAHLHSHVPNEERHGHGPLGVGLLHGMAGSGHLFGVLPALALPTAEAAIYLVAYLAAAVLSMTCFAIFLGYLSKRGGTEWIPRLMAGAGIAAVAVGVIWLQRSWPI